MAAMAGETDVAVIGAGPYGLAVTAHLSSLGVRHRAFGSPMQTWRTGMPRGMVLKSEGFASNLYDPAGEFTLAAFCIARGEAYADMGLPIKLDTFINYGIAFQQRLVPELDQRAVARVEAQSNGFELHLDDGEMLRARRVVVASGIQQYAYTPPQLEALPAPLSSHSAAHRDLERFHGSDVVVVGAGASAMDLAALLDQQGARVTVVSRRSQIRWCGAPGPRSMVEKIRSPVSGLGTGWRSWACASMPMVFYQMPGDFRAMIVRRHLGPAPGWSVREHVETNVPIVHGTLAHVRSEGWRAELTIRQSDGVLRKLSADHVIAATGYRVDMRSLKFLSTNVQSALRCLEHAPILSPHFESSVPGLYFVGAAAANSFGPMLRFAFGAGFAASRVTRHLARTAARRSAPASVSLSAASA